jgi:acyl-coenzyme A synthetase/AMP-(fatty) acid ligase
VIVTLPCKFLRERTSRLRYPTKPTSIWIDGSPDTLGCGPVEVAYDGEAARKFETLGGFAAVENAARKFPDKIAVDDGEIRLTYAQFIDRVYGLAECINSATEPNSVVTSVLPNTSAAPIAIMACALSGRILVPIDASHPLERQQAIFAEAGARALLIAAGKQRDIDFIPATLPRLVVDPFAQTSAVRPPHQYDPDAPLFVTFTSGSTGRPKGVVSGARFGGAFLRQLIDMFHLNAEDVVLGLASLSTGGARDAFAALGVGATIRVFDMSNGGFAEALRILDHDKISVLSFVPSALRAVLSTPGAEQAFRHLRLLDLHGERILASDIALFRSKLPTTCHISITMGSIEAGAVFTWFVRDEKIDGAVVPIGYPWPRKRVALLSDDGRPVADGEIGELFVRGQMAMGAWRNGRMVQGPFLPDPEDPSSSIYAMGDLVRRRADGLFEYIGRKDRKVKVRGLWADLGEVEAALRGIDGVTDAVAISRTTDGEGERIAAFLVMAPGVAPVVASFVRRTVAQEAAEHMAPADVHVLSAIPRLANFKPDLLRLGEIARAQA